MPCVPSIFMMCQRIGFPPISPLGFGRPDVSSANRLPSPPARITAFMRGLSASSRRRQATVLRYGEAVPYRGIGARGNVRQCFAPPVHEDHDQPAVLGTAPTEERHFLPAVAVATDRPC